MKSPLLVALLSLSGWAQQAHVNLEWNPQSVGEGFKPFGASVISPEVHADRRVTFRVSAPGASEVLLGDGPLQRGYAGGEKKFAKGADGIWTLTVGPVAPNMYVYKLNIDGASVPDPNNTIAGVGDQPPYSMLSETMSVQARLRVVVEYVSSNEEQFKDLILLMMDFYRYSRSVAEASSEAMELEKTRGLFRDLLGVYRDAVQEHAGVKVPGLGQVIVSMLIGSLLQRIVDPAGASIEDAHACLASLLPQQG